MNKKASVLDVTPILMLLFSMGLFAIVMLLVINTVNSDFQSDLTLPTQARTIMANGASQAPGIFDFWFMVLFVGLPLISAVFAYFNNIHPLFFWISLFLVLLIVIVGAGLAQLWTEISTDSDLDNTAATMPMADLILGNFGLYSFFVFIIIATGTFVKLRGQDAYGGFNT